MFRWLILASFSLLVACAGPSATRGEKLADASRMLHASLVVRDYRSLATMLESQLRMDFMAVSQDLEKRLSITEIELLSMTMAADGDAAETLSRISYFELPSTVVKTETIRVQWKYTAQEWLIQSAEGGPLPLARDQKGISSSPSPNPPEPPPEP